MTAGQAGVPRGPAEQSLLSHAGQGGGSCSGVRGFGPSLAPGAPEGESEDAEPLRAGASHQGDGETETQRDHTPARTGAGARLCRTRSVGREGRAGKARKAPGPLRGAVSQLEAGAAGALLSALQAHLSDEFVLT